MAIKSKLKTLKLKVVFSLENAQGEQLTVIGTRKLYEGTYSHQLVIMMTSLLHEIFQRTITHYIKYLNHGTLPNEIVQYDHDGMRVAARAKAAVNKVTI